MAQVIKYKFLSAEINHGTEEEPNIEQIILDKSMSWSTANEEIAKREAYKGEYTIVDDSKYHRITAPHNILEGEYVTIGGVLYKATTNIPNGEPVIVGQNAIVTTMEEQLYELMKGE